MDLCSDARCKQLSGSNQVSPKHGSVSIEMLLCQRMMDSQRAYAAEGWLPSRTLWQAL